MTRSISHLLRRLTLIDWSGPLTAAGPLSAVPRRWYTGRFPSVDVDPGRIRIDGTETVPAVAGYTVDYDQGGTLIPGVNLIINLTGKPEPLYQPE